MALDTIFRVTAQFITPESTIAQWVWHYRQSTVGASGNQAFLDAVELLLTDAWAEIEAQIINTVVGDTLELAVYSTVLKEFDTILSNDISALNGGVAGVDMLPHQESPVVTFFTTVGRSLGKKFLFGFVETMQAGSILTAPALVNMALFGDEFRQGITAAGNDYEAGNFNLLAELFRAWTSTIGVNVLLGTQDRRRPGIGI